MTTPPPLPLVIQTEHLDAEPAQWLAQHVELVRASTDDPRFGDLLARAEALIVRTYTIVDAALLARAPKLRVVGRGGVGVDNIDLAACAARGVTVVNTPDANTRAVVEYVTAQMLDALRPRVFLHRVLDKKAWNAAREELTAPRQLAGLTLGIYGLGRIGSQIARLGAALDMRVIYHDLRTIEAPARHGAHPVSRETLLADADVLTVHVDGRPGNRGLLDVDAFGRMKSSVVFINTSRGFVVDPVACAEFMIAHPSACALLDVHEPEPFDARSPLLEIKNVHLAPHLASCTAQAKKNMSWVVRDVWEVLQGRPPRHPVLPGDPG